MRKSAHRTALAVTVTASMLFAASFAVPAVGGPSVTTVYNVARNALKKAKKAQKTANRALARGSSAGIVTVTGQESAIPPFDVGARPRPALPA